jgi:very-short-patch-repair endonuclease
VASALSGLPAPVPRFEIVHEGTWLARVDLARPEARVVVEHEGEHHVDGLQVGRDDVRLRRLVAARRTVIRLSAADLRSMDDVVRRIGETLGVVPRVG